MACDKEGDYNEDDDEDEDISYLNRKNFKQPFKQM